MTHRRALKKTLKDAQNGSGIMAHHCRRQTVLEEDRCELLNCAVINFMYIIIGRSDLSSMLREGLYYYHYYYYYYNQYKYRS